MATEEGLMTILSNFLEDQAKLFNEQAKRLREFASTGVIPKVEESKPTKKTRPPKDPNQPKPPPSGYILYSQSVMNDVREEYKNEPQRNIMTIIANKWKDAPEREHFQQLAHQKKLEYEEKLKNYKDSLPHAEATKESSSSSSSTIPEPKQDSKPKIALNSLSSSIVSAVPSSKSVPENTEEVVESEKKKHKKHKHEVEENADESDKKKKV